MQQRLARWWAAWVDFWDEVEHPRSLALVRIGLALCLVYDLAHIWQLDLVLPLYGVADEVGLSDALMREDTPLFYRWMPGTAGSARLLHAAMLLPAISLLLGFFTRTSALVLLVAWAQFASIMPYADRGIDTLCRLIITLLIFAPSGAWLSVDAMIRTGSPWGDGAPVGAWARRLLIGQLVLMYFSAGILKNGLTWWPFGHFTALYFALQDPAVAAYDFSFVRDQPFFLFTQLGTMTTMLYQLTYPLVLVLMWWHRNPGRGGRIAALATRYRLELLWIGVGFVFHVILGIVMNLGIFPWAMLSLYPAFVHPDAWPRLVARLRGASPGPGGA